MGGGPMMPTGPAWEAAVVERNWLLWKLVPRPGKKPTKHPASPAGLAPISASDAARLTFAEAHDALDRLNEQYGLGYLPRPGSELVGLDFDDVLTDMARLRAQPWYRSLYATWVERSPSGKGLRAILARRYHVTERSSSYARRWGHDFAPCPEVTKEARGFGYFGAAGRFFTVTLDKFGPDAATCEVNCSLRLVKEVLALAEGRPIERREADTTVRSVSTPAMRWFDRLSEERQVAEIERMLGHLTDPKFGNNFDLWRAIGFAVYHATDSMGYEIWDSWCRRLPNYDASENAKIWGRFHTDRPDAITIGTLIHHAREHGYRPPPDALDHRLRDLARRLARARFHAALARRSLA
jgi:hypothetical protein